MSKEFFALCLFVLPQVGLAGIDRFEAIDKINCQHWYVTSEVDIFSAEYKKLERHRELVLSGRNNAVGSILTAHDLSSGKETDLSLCILEEKSPGHPSSVSCEAGGNFPLAGMRFDILQNGGQGASSFKCTRNCPGKTPYILYDFSSDYANHANDLRRELKEFKAACKRKN